MGTLKSTTPALFALVVFLAHVYDCTAQQKGLTNEDIRDAILSLAHMFRDSQSKLERHENRERQLGEVLKRALSGLDKRERAQDTMIENLAAAVDRLSDKLNQIHEAVAQDERAKGTYTVESMEPLQEWMTHVEHMINSTSSNPASGYIEKAFSDKLEKLSHTVQDTTHSYIAAQESQASMILMNLQRQNDVMESILRDHQEVAQLQKELQSNINGLQGSIEYATENIMNIADRERSHGGGGADLTELLNLARDQANVTSLIQSKLDGVQDGLKGVDKVEEVMVSTADSLMATKRRIEYGVQQILVELGQLVREEASGLNSTINYRFDGISQVILANQNEGLTNLSTKVEQEISQVWRQIGIMYQQLTDSASALDRLQKQTEIYVNGSLSTMDSMEGKVGQITGRMSEVDESLNYLLGRLSLVTHEFNEIKTELTRAFKSIRSSFQTVQDQVKEAELGRGPNPIESSDPADVDNRL